MKRLTKAAWSIPILLLCFLAAFYGVRHFSAASAAPSAAASAGTPASGMPAAATRQFALNSLQKIPMKIGSHTLKVWVMDTDAKREEGMMFLHDKQVKPNEGMLFVFPYAAPLSFWMRNTLIPLDVAYLGADKRIINIAQMKALDETPIPSNGPAQYALEVKKGTLEKWSVKDGTRVVFPEVMAQDPPPPSPFAPAAP